jgi:hypothetical protein
MIVKKSRIFVNIHLKRHKCPIEKLRSRHENTLATRRLLVWKRLCDKLELAGKALLFGETQSQSIAFPATSRPSHRPGDPDQKETEAPVRDLPS